MYKRIVIIGAGPTGLGAAYRLNELGHGNWDIYEKEYYPGGCSASFTDENGFVWDQGGHVIFSHYPYFDSLLDKLLKNEYIEHMRESWIRILNMWVPYPFQNNIGRLPKDLLLECLIGLIDTNNSKAAAKASNFRDWIMAVFGSGISKYFMIPYNSKVWAIPLEMMDKQWIGERVSVVDIRRILENLIYQRDDVSWGPNNKFKFPLKGGTGDIFRRIGLCLQGHLYLNKELVEIDTRQKILSFDNGTIDKYDVLITTIPLNILSQVIKPEINEITSAASSLKYNSVLVVGIGLEKKIKTKRCWVYFPEDNSPFYRITYFSNYSPFNVPDGDTNKYSSIMCETSYSPYKQEDKTTITHRTIQGLINTGIIETNDRSKIISTNLKDIKYAYPIPTLERDTLIRNIQPLLEKHDIYSRGRFGGWKYEVGNMDHSVMQGVEIINRLLLKDEETTYAI